MSLVLPGVRCAKDQMRGGAGGAVQSLSNFLAEGKSISYGALGCTQKLEISLVNTQIYHLT